jgi:4-amino-4-deoxy-L-arabinose transferase-like glycosyltransferase
MVRTRGGRRGSPDPLSRRTWLALLAVAAAGLVIRVVYVLAFARGAGGFGDFQFYNAVPGLLIDGHGFSNPFDFAFGDALRPTAAHPPAWPFLLAGVSAIFGNGASPADLAATGFTAHRLTGCVVGTVGIVLVGLLAHRVAGHRVALIAAAIVAFSPTTIGVDGSTMSEALYAPLITLVLLVAYAVRDRGSWWTAAALGAAIGLAALTRAEALLLVLLLGAPVVWHAGKNWQRRALLGAALLAACVIVVAPWTIRNWSVFDRPVVISTNEGFLWAMANCPQTYSGPLEGFASLDCLPRKRSPNEAAYAAAARRKGLNYAKDHAGELPPVLVVRLLRTWGLWQPFRDASETEGVPRRVNETSVVVEWLLDALAVIGFVLLRRRGAPLWILLSPVVLVCLVTILGHGLARYRYAAEPSLIVLAAITIEWAVAQWPAVARRRSPDLESTR